MEYPTVDYIEGLKLIRSRKCPVCGGKIHEINDTRTSPVSVPESVKKKFDLHGLSVTCPSCGASWTMLEHKKILPALIGIDEGLDKLIAERLK